MKSSPLPPKEISLVHHLSEMAVVCLYNMSLSFVKVGDQDNFKLYKHNMRLMDRYHVVMFALCVHWHL